MKKKPLKVKVKVRRSSIKVLTTRTVATHPQAAELRQWLLRYPSYKDTKEIVKRA